MSSARLRRPFVIFSLAAGIFFNCAAKNAGATEAALAQLRAAALSNPETAFDLAVRLDAGLEVPRDSYEALIWYARAAMGGESRAFLYLDQRYETGDGVPRNVALARKLYLAADDTVSAATRRLEKMSTRGTIPDLRNRASFRPRTQQR